MLGICKKITDRLYLCVNSSTT